MESLLQSFFSQEKIEYYASSLIEKIDKAHIIRPDKLMRLEKPLSVIAFLIPYNITGEDKNVSSYAVAEDYHLYTKQLEQRLRDFLSKNGHSANACVFADNSPFSEVLLAKSLGLGFIGKNGLLINQKYGSYVFVGEIVFDKELNFRSHEFCDIDSCLDCKKCLDACPAKCIGADKKGESCLSALTQKKQLSQNELAVVSRHELVWGCDVCQAVCPHNKAAAKTPIEFFKSNRLPKISEKLIQEMSDEEFSKRAYSWRGRAVILRNLSSHKGSNTIITDFDNKINTENP